MSKLAKKHIYFSQYLKTEIQRSKNGVLLWIKGPNGTNFRYFANSGKVRRIYFNDLDRYIIGTIIEKSKLNSLQIFYNIQKKTVQKQESDFNGLLQSQLRTFSFNVVTGYKKSLTLRGVGYKFIIKKHYLGLQIGFSHELNIVLSSDLLFKINRKSTAIKFKTTNVSFLSNFLASLKRLRKPDIYKGKGIRYKKEKIVRKEGKKKKTI